MNEKPQIDTLAEKIVDQNYAKNKHKTPFTQVAENAVKELGFKYNSTTGTFRNNDGKTLPMKEALEATEALDKNFKDQKTDNYLAKLKRFGIEHSQTKHAGYPKPKKSVNYLSDNYSFEENFKKQSKNINNQKLSNEERRKQNLLKTWGIEDGPHNPDFRNIIRNAVSEADSEKKNINNPTVNKYKAFKEKKKKELEDKKFNENYEKEYGDQANRNYVRAKVNKNIRAGKAPYEDLPSEYLIVGEDTKKRAQKQLAAVKAEHVKLEPTYIDYRLSIKDPTPTISLEEHMAKVAPKVIDPGGITELNGVRKFRETMEFANEKFPRSLGGGLAPLVGEDS